MYKNEDETLDLAREYINKKEAEQSFMKRVLLKILEKLTKRSKLIQRMIVKYRNMQKEKII